MSRRRQGAASDRTRSRTFHCAIYTRKSSDEGLEQSFNSLDAQRDACEAFILSQKHEGWVGLPDAYNDGGFSGGSMERPALRRLLESVRNGSVDVVVVYKVDRLTRSLSDFAKLTELFDQHGTSFVSVTQQFNTSTSMGRLTLNVLLSFAQFEREVAGERIRDKIALSKRRGMWMGGLPPLGYDGKEGKLIVNAVEAETVRLIFRRYLEAGSVAELKHRLDQDGIVSKRRVFADGKTAGGVPISRGAIYQILRNRLYRGEIAHRGEVHQGNHQPIIDEELWDMVQARLTDQSQRARGSKAKPGSGPLLSGRVFDGDGKRMTPTYAIKGGRQYRYYVSASLVRGGSKETGIRVPAYDLESLVREAIADHLRDPLWIGQLLAKDTDARATKRFIEGAGELAQSIMHDSDGKREPAADDPVRSLVNRVTVSKETVTITIDHVALSSVIAARGDDLTLTGDGTPVEIAVAARSLRCGKQVRLVAGNVTTERRSVDPKLVRLIADAHRWFEDLRTGRAATIAEIAARDGQQVSHVSRTLPLAFLAPDIVTTDSGRPPSTDAHTRKAQSPPATPTAGVVGTARIAPGITVSFHPMRRMAPHCICEGQNRLRGPPGRNLPKEQSDRRYQQQ